MWKFGSTNTFMMMMIIIIVVVVVVYCIVVFPTLLECFCQVLKEIKSFQEVKQMFNNIANIHQFLWLQDSILYRKISFMRIDMMDLYSSPNSGWYMEKLAVNDDNPKNLNLVRLHLKLLVKW